MNCGKFNNYSLDECLSYNDNKKTFIMDNNGTKILMNINPEYDDINSLRMKFNNNYETNFLIQKITNLNKYDLDKANKDNHYILLNETPLLYDSVFKNINYDKANNNLYINTYNNILKSYIENNNDMKTSFGTLNNLFDVNNMTTPKDLDLKNEISYYLNNNDKKKRICFNVFQDYYILILPNILGAYNQTFSYNYNNIIPEEYEFDTLINLIEKYTNDKTNKLFNIYNETIINEMKNYIKFTHNKYWLDSYKSQNINYACFIIPQNNNSIIYNIRDLTKIKHLDLLEYVYQLSNNFIYGLHTCASDQLRMYMRTVSDVYGMVYFKIQSITPYNYYVVKQGSHDKEIDITNILHNLTHYDDYYKHFTFEYNLSFVQYKRHEQLFKKYFETSNELNNIIRINRQIKLIEEKIIETKYNKQKWKITCEDTKIKNKKDNNKNNMLCMQNQTLTKSYNDICFVYNNNNLCIQTKKFKIIRLFINYLNYTLLCKCNENFYVLTLEPKHVQDNYKIFLSSMCNTELIFNNNNFELYKTQINSNKNYFNSYKITDIKLIDINFDIMKDSYTKIFYDISMRTRIYETNIIKNQIKYHINKNIGKSTTKALIITNIFQKIFLGIDDVLIEINKLGLNIFDFFYISNNKSFIMIPDLKWFDKKIENVNNILNNTITSHNTHYTIWYNPYNEYIINENGKNIFILWENAIKINNKIYVNPNTFINIIKTHNDKHLLKNLYKLYNLNKNKIDVMINLFNLDKTKYINEYINKNDDITNIIITFYNGNNLDIISKNKDDIHYISYIDNTNSLLLKDIKKEVYSFINSKYNNVETIFYVHNTTSVDTFIFHIHVVTKIIGLYNSNIFEPNYSAIKLNDIDENLKIDSNYYSKFESSYVNGASYTKLYVNITDQCDPLLHNYPYFPTFALKVVNIDDINIIYPNKNANKSLLNIDYDNWKNSYVYEIYYNKNDLINRLEIIKLCIKKQVIQFIDQFVYGNIDKTKCIKYFKEDFVNSNIDINMWKDNISKLTLIDLFYDSLELETMNWLPEFYWNKTIKIFYKDYCDKYNEIKKIPFTLNEWLNNTNIKNVFFDKKIYDFYMNECDVFKDEKQFFDEQWLINNGIRDFYNIFINKFKKTYNVKTNGEIEKM